MQVPVAMEAIVVESRFPLVCVSMPRRMLYSKLVENEFAKALSCTATRKISCLTTEPDPGTNYDRCPCLTCSIKITQVGISEVVYSRSYSMDSEVSASRRASGSFLTLAIDRSCIPGRRCEAKAIPSGALLCF